MTVAPIKQVKDNTITVEMLAFPDGATNISNIMASLFDIAEPRLDDAGLRRLSMNALAQASQIATAAAKAANKIGMLAASENPTGTEG